MRNEIALRGKRAHHRPGNAAGRSIVLHARRARVGAHDDE
jgi:hypothetical protein